MTPVIKKGSKKEACNYRPVSLTSVPCKILEQIIFHHIMGHLDAHHVLVNYQHGFFSKAFDTAPHKRLPKKLDY